MFGDARVLLRGLVGLARPRVQIAERIGGHPVARLVLDDACVLDDGGIEPPLTKQLLPLLQRIFTIEGHEGVSTSRGARGGEDEAEASDRQL